MATSKRKSPAKKRLSKSLDRLWVIKAPKKKPVAKKKPAKRKAPKPRMRLFLMEQHRRIPIPGYSERAAKAASDATGYGVRGYVNDEHVLTVNEPGSYQRIVWY